MELKVININEDVTDEIYASNECQEVIKSMNEYYPKIGFHKPWVGYFVVRNKEIVGAGGFTGQPKDGKVEIAYGTFKEFEGQGVASFACKELVLISTITDPAIIITAKTAPEQNASAKILQNNNFEPSGIVQDHEIGDAWLWTYKTPELKLNNQ
ncbi:GNAT family N-acetyltransferase [Daejeonella sp.]|uniref:GNAT family N-acetyltransferase n=1 Tax=Daejeonella sp. TaxID=2805397 RepID=UPI0030BB0F9A